MNKLKIDIVSDVVCPWCIIGYQALDQALTKLGPQIQAELHWQPFELNPHMAPQGQDLREHITEKYGITVEQSQQNRQMIEQRAADLGFTIRFAEDSRIYNTFDAHRLLHWAAEDAESDQQTKLKLALFKLYFTDGGDPSDQQQLLQVVEQVGLDVSEAKELLNSDRYLEEVRAAQDKYRQLGISSVPTYIINDKYAISGGQPVEAFEQALREISSQAD